MMRSIKSFLGYLFCLAVAALLAYEISGSGGIFIIVLLVIALVISAVSLLVTVKKIIVDLQLSTDIVSKGDSFDAQIKLDKGSFLPSCFIEVTVGFTGNIASAEYNGQTDEYASSVKIKTVCAVRGDTIVEIPLKAEYSGCGEVFIQSVVLTDYLGIFSKTLKNEYRSLPIKVIPNIPDTGSQTEVLRSTSENISYDDSDEESNETAQGITGVAGYEHRQYVPGDPIKRINWKLSSKRDILMIRLDEKVTSSSQVFVLDYPQKENADRDYIKNADLIIEASLAMLSMLLRNGFESDFSFCLDQWETVQVNDEKALQYVQERLAGLKPYSPQKRFPDQNINKKGKSMICFTSCTGDMTKELSVLLETFNGSLVVTKNSGVGKITSDMWAVNDEFEFNKLK